MTRVFYRKVEFLNRLEIGRESLLGLFLFCKTSFLFISCEYKNLVLLRLSSLEGKEKSQCAYLLKQWHTPIFGGFSFQWRRALTIVVQSFALSYRAVGFIFLMKKIPGNCCSKLFFIA
jgi:hypothetical protein